jgi:hypothetical protein
MIRKLLTQIDNFRAMRVRQTSDYPYATASIPPNLYAYWKRTARIEFKGIPSDAFFFASACEGLLKFFDCVRSSDKPCALPSAAADSVWHAWARLDPARLEQFCLDYFGRTIAHTEAADMSVPMEQALANSLVTARRLERLPAAGLKLPRLFILDRTLRMPKGYAYTLHHRQVAFRRNNVRGKPEGQFHTPEALAPLALLAAHFVTLEEYASFLKEDLMHKKGFSIEIGGGGDLAGDGGSSCSGCGGGCS